MEMNRSSHKPVLLLTLLLSCFMSGCGATKSQTATEQLLLSDAVDHSVAEIDFSVLSGQKVYLDSTYLQHVKGVGFVNSGYIISSLRQQMIRSGCLLYDNHNDADFIVEARIGTLGLDRREVTYGVPASSALSTAASIFPNSPPIPAIPEISVARRDDASAASKIAAFAYHRETRAPVWQSGIAPRKSNARDYWVMGAGPFQSGTIYDRPEFAGQQIKLPEFNQKEEADQGYFQARTFLTPQEMLARKAAGEQAELVAKKSKPSQAKPSNAPAKKRPTTVASKQQPKSQPEARTASLPTVISAPKIQLQQPASFKKSE